MSERFYYYTLSPYCVRMPSVENEYEIDLNTSLDFKILFKMENQDADSRENQLKRIEFIKSHTEELNLAAHMLMSVKNKAMYSEYELECMKIYADIISGKYGEYPVEFFEKEENNKTQEKILYRLVQKEKNNRRHDYFECILKDVFGKNVFFYHDKIKKVLYVSLVTEGTEDNKKIYEVCKYFFADLLIDITVRWRSYPAIIERSNYVIASEGEQLCGTIL